MTQRHFGKVGLMVSYAGTLAALGLIGAVVAKVF